MEKDIGSVPKSDAIKIMIQISDFEGNLGLTIREYVESDKYTGFTKSGTKIPAKQFEKFKALINSINPEDLKSEEELKEKEINSESIKKSLEN